MMLDNIYQTLLVILGNSGLIILLEKVFESKISSEIYESLRSVIIEKD